MRFAAVLLVMLPALALSQSAGQVVPLPVVGKISKGGPLAPDGKTEVQVDLPVDQAKRNIAARGLGCCVFRSLDHASRWQEVPQLFGMPEWMVQKGIAGGGWPGKCDDLIPKISKDRGMPTPAYIQYEGTDMAILKTALQSGRMPCITYNGHDGVYYSGNIAHMVNLVHLDDNFAGILDNNYITSILWLSPEEFKSRWCGGGNGWAVVLLSPGPPAPPTNGATLLDPVYQRGSQ